MFLSSQDFRKEAQAETADIGLVTYRHLHGARSVRHGVLVFAEEAAWRREVNNQIVLSNAPAPGICCRSILGHLARY